MEWGINSDYSLKPTVDYWDIYPTVSCGKLHLQSVTIGDPNDTYKEPKPQAPSHFTAIDADTGDTLFCARTGQFVSCTK